MGKLKYYDVFVNGRRQAVYLKGDADRRIDQLKAEIEALREIVIGLPEWNGKSLDYYLSPVRKESK